LGIYFGELSFLAIFFSHLLFIGLILFSFLVLPLFQPSASPSFFLASFETLSGS